MAAGSDQEKGELPMEKRRNPCRGDPSRDQVNPDVTFTRPDIRALREAGFTPVDMHFHTVHTDGLVSIRALLSKVRARGIGCAVTDHNEISGALQACRERGDLPVVPGIEISAMDGPHLLLWFYSARDLEDYFQRYIRDRRCESPWLLTQLTTEEVLEAAEGYSCVRAPAHPYGYLIFNGGLAKCIEKGYLDRELYARCEAIEGICSNMTHAENLRAVALARRLDLPVTGGTDGHLLSDLGTAVTCTKAGSPEEFLDELRKGRARVIGREKHLPSKLVTGAVISARFLPWFYPSLKIHCAGAGRRMHRYLLKRRHPIRPG
jgi:predicted metal-dependent phosphoesterase TrpH